MVVKDATGRSRYIAFTVEAERPPSPTALAAALDEALGPVLRDRVQPRVIEFDGAWGILRCAHTLKDEAIAALRGLRAVDGEAVRVVTVGTSGTLRKARRKYRP